MSNTNFDSLSLRRSLAWPVRLIPVMFRTVFHFGVERVATKTRPEKT